MFQSGIKISFSVQICSKKYIRKSNAEGWTINKRTNSDR